MTLTRSLSFIAFVSLIFLVAPSQAQVKNPDIQPTLTVDLNRSIIIVDTTYDGADILAFGVAPKREESDLIVLVNGPRVDASLLQKQKEWGLWVGHIANTFISLPGFYFLASTKPVDDILDDDVIKDYGLSLQSYLVDDTDTEQFSILQGILNRERLYTVNSSNLLTYKNNLFRLPIKLPSHSPPGVYSVSVFVVKNKTIHELTTTSLWVRKEGLDAFITETARTNPLIYGIAWSFFSLFMGLIIFLVFNYRRMK